MKIREFVSNAPVKIISSVLIIPFLIAAAMASHSHFSLTNPYLVAVIYYALQSLIMMFYMFVDNDFDGNYSPKILVRMSRILSSIKLVTAIAISSFADMKDIPPLLLVFLFFMLVWFISTGLTGIVCHYALPASKTLMRKHETVKVARSEEELLKDLNQYLTKADMP